MVESIPSDLGGQADGGLAEGGQAEEVNLFDHCGPNLASARSLIRTRPSSGVSARALVRSLHFPLLASIIIAAGALAAAGLSGCGDFFAKTTSSGSGSGSSTTTTDYLYVANNNSSLNTIAGFSLSSGALVATKSSPYLVGETPSTLALSPNNSLLYVGSALAGIYVFTVGSDRSLTIGNGGVAVATVSASSMAVDPSGNWLLVLQNELTGSAPVISVYAIDTATGALTVPTGTVPLALDGGTAGQLLIVPSTTTTHYVYATLGTDGVDVLTFNTTTGVLGKQPIRLNTLGNAYSDNSLAADSTGTYLYVGETGANAVRSFTIGSNGTLTALATTPTTAAGTGGGALLVDATDSYLYSIDTAQSTISAFSISSVTTTAGSLTPLATPSYTTGTAPVAMVEDNTKGYLAVVCSGGTPDLDVFPISAAGALGAPLTASTGSVNPAGASAIAASH